MNKFENIFSFFEKNYLDYLLEKNITMVHFKNGKTITFLIYQDELFIFNSSRSLNQAYKFYNVEKELCLEGVEYFKITKNYLSYIQENDINISKGYDFTIDGVNYLINYYTKGYKNESKLSVAKVNKKMFLLLDFCENLMESNLDVDISEEKTAIVKIEKKINYIIDLYQIDSIEPNELSNKFSVHKEFRELITDKEAVLDDARIGIFFSDGYRDCLTLEESRSGGFIYYSLGDENLMVYKFDTISLKELYIVLQQLFSEFIPVTLTTSNEFLFDILFKTFDGKIDFILEKNNRYNDFIKELGVVLTLNNYTDYKMDAFCLIIENNFNALVKDMDKLSVLEYETILEECTSSYKLSNLDDGFDDFDDELEDVEEVNEEDDVDSTLFS